MLWRTCSARTGAMAVMIAVLAGSARAAEPDRAGQLAGTRTIDQTTYFDANSLLMFIGNTGTFAHDKTSYLGRNQGLYFPKGTSKTAVFAAGIWVGAKVNGETRVSVAQYSDEFVPGAMLGGTFQPDNPAFKVYKITRGDTRQSNPDYANWPFAQGAPVVKDHAGNDSIGSDGFRIPQLRGRQALWTVFNDADPAVHTNGAGATPPLGLEIQLYAYGDDLTCPLDRTVVLEYRILNKGVNSLESTYIALWTDPDIGKAGNDRTGCDSNASFGFCYDTGPDSVYPAVPPAVGFDLLQGPVVPSPSDSAWNSTQWEWIPGFRNLPLTAFRAYENGTDPASAIEALNFMKGLERDGGQIVDPTTGLVTTFMYSGNPQTGFGWVDLMPADKRGLIATGPFNMAPEDTQEIVAAIIVSVGTGGAYDTIPAVHIQGTSGGTAAAYIVDPLSTTGHDYRISFQLSADSTIYQWSVRDLTTDLVVMPGWYNQSGDNDYPIFDGLMTKVIGPAPGISGWEVPSGTRRFTWKGARGLGFDAFGGAIGWSSPYSLFNSTPPVVLMSQLTSVLLKLAPVAADGTFDPNDPNVSFGYRYGRAFANPAARPEFAPFIVNASTGYAYQDFTRSIPLSAWDISTTPPRRLALGHLENNQPGGTVDGKYWPPNGHATDNVSAAGPREWLWVFNTDYSTSPDPAFEVDALNSRLPIAYFLSVARDGDLPFADGDEFLIIHDSTFNSEPDTFVFSAPAPYTPSPYEIPVCGPGAAWSSVTELLRLDSLVQAAFFCGVYHCPHPGDPDGNGLIDVFDVINVIGIAFSGEPDPQDPGCPRTRGDANDDGATDVFDVIYLIATAFSGGPNPISPCTL